MKKYFFIVLLLLDILVSLFLSLTFPSFKLSFTDLFVITLLTISIFFIVIPSILWIIKIIVMRLFLRKNLEVWKEYKNIFLIFSFICYYPALLLFFILHNYIDNTYFSYIDLYGGNGIELYGLKLFTIGRILSLVIIFLVAVLEYYLFKKKFKITSLEDSNNFDEKKKFFWVSVGANLISYCLVMYLFNMLTGFGPSWLHRIDWWYLLYQMIN